MSAGVSAQPAEGQDIFLGCLVCLKGYVLTFPVAVPSAGVSFRIQGAGVPWNDSLKMRGGPMNPQPCLSAGSHCLVLVVWSVSTPSMLACIRPFTFLPHCKEYIILLAVGFEICLGELRLVFSFHLINNRILHVCFLRFSHLHLHTRMSCPGFLSVCWSVWSSGGGVAVFSWVRRF